MLPNKNGYLIIIFLTYAVDTLKNHLNEAVLLSTQTICLN